MGAIRESGFDRGDPGRRRSADAGQHATRNTCTFERLVALGYAPEDARRLIGNVVTQEIFAVMQRGEAYNEQRYIKALHGLPDSTV